MSYSTHHFTIFTGMLLLLTLTFGCKDNSPAAPEEEDTPDPEVEIPVLFVSTTTLQVGSAGGEESFEISNTGEGELEWEIGAPAEDWLNLSPSFVTNAGTIILQYEQNVVDESRSVTLAITSNGGDEDLVVEQARVSQKIIAWGHDNYGQSTVPDELTDVNAVEGGGYHCLALRRNGTVAA